MNPAPLIFGAVFLMTALVFAPADTDRHAHLAGAVVLMSMGLAVVFARKDK